MTWDLLALETLGENWVAAPKVAVAKKITEETVFTTSCTSRKYYEHYKYYTF